MPPLKPITLEHLIRGERLVDELTSAEVAAMLTALLGEARIRFYPMLRLPAATSLPRGYSGGYPP